MLQSSIVQLYEKYGNRLAINLMSVYPEEDKEQVPYDFINIIPTTPEQLIFIAFPLAVFFRLFHWFPPVRSLLRRNRILKAYMETDLVIDEAGVSFVDSRGFVMNTYAFICAAVPLFLGVPVVKYSQAMGTFHNPYNRMLAKIILPKLKLICARGKITADNLESIGIKSNVKLCADGAFSMPDSPAVTKRVAESAAADSFYEKDVVGLSISSVLYKRCKKRNIDYVGILQQFIRCLTERGYHVLIIANAARIGSTKLRNNDLMIGDAIYAPFQEDARVKWHHKEMEAEEIREYIGKCRFLVVSRFHAMIAGLEKKKPVFLIEWSHKYKEVLDMFDLGKYAADYSSMSLSAFMEGFRQLEKDEESIRCKIEEHYDYVMESSRSNIKYISDILEDSLAQKRNALKSSKVCCRSFRDLTPELCIGDYMQLRKGYATDETVRKNASSGGTVTALLCNMLQNGDIDGAFVTKTFFDNGKLCAKSYIAASAEEIRSASSSVYMSIPVLKELDAIKNFPGRLAIVMTPCMMKAFSVLMERDPALKDKIILKIGLYCSGQHKIEATLLPLKKKKISLENASRFIYRRGHWRGKSVMLYTNKPEQVFSYAKTICAYKNAYFFVEKKCMTCTGLFSSDADISFGDIWLKEMKKEKIKYTSCVIRNEKALRYWKRAVSQGVIIDGYISAGDMLRSQKRALTFQYLCCENSKKWNYRLAYSLAEKNRVFSMEHYHALSKIPITVIYYYMCFIRALLSI